MIDGYAGQALTWQVQHGRVKISLRTSFHGRFQARYGSRVVTEAAGTGAQGGRSAVEDHITTASERITGSGDGGRRMRQITRERARRARATAAMAHARVLKVAETVAAAEDQFAATLEQLAESQPHYTDHLHALSSHAREQAAAERRWANSYALMSPLAGNSQAGASGQALSSQRDTADNGAFTPAMMWSLVDAFPDAVALTDGDGLIVLASRRLGEMFGYERDELIGRPVETLVPAALRAAHRDHRAAYMQAPRIKPKDDRAPLAGLRKDGGTVMVEISLSPVTTEAGLYALAVIREASEPWAREGFPELARAAAASQEHRRQEAILLGQVVNNLYKAGRSLRDTIATPSRTLAERTAEAVQMLDDTIREVRQHILKAHRGGTGHNSVTGDRVD